MPDLCTTLSNKTLTLSPVFFLGLIQSGPVREHNCYLVHNKISQLPHALTKLIFCLLQVIGH